MPNKEIREFMRKHGIFVWEVANRIGCGEATIYRWLRTPLRDAQRKRVLSAVTDIVNERTKDIQEELDGVLNESE